MIKYHDLLPGLHPRLPAARPADHTHLRLLRAAQDEFWILPAEERVRLTEHFRDMDPLVHATLETDHVTVLCVVNSE
jgi:hypothetical protein